MNSKESENTSAAAQAQPEPVPKSGPEPNFAAAPAPNAGGEQQALAAPAPVRKKRASVQDPTFGGVLGTLETLSPAEQAELFACEQVIESGWATFVQVGLALATIKNNRLYRLDFGCFEDYCRAKWSSAAAKRTT
jgi:hypothetical protein